MNTRRLACGRRTLARIIGVALLVVATMGTALYANPEPAEAGGWSTVAGAPGNIVMVACKTPINSIYGPLWRVQVGTANGSNDTFTLAAQVRRGGYYGQVIHSITRTLAPNDWPPNGTMYMSRLPWMRDSLWFGIGEGSNVNMWGTRSIGSIAYC